MKLTAAGKVSSRVNEIDSDREDKIDRGQNIKINIG